MQELYSEILFALYAGGGQGTLGWLVSFVKTGAEQEERETKQAIGTLAKMGFLSLALKGEQVSVALTDKGTKAATLAADVISTRMVEMWQQSRTA